MRAVVLKREGMDPMAQRLARYRERKRWFPGHKEGRAYGQWPVQVDPEHVGS